MRRLALVAIAVFIVAGCGGGTGKVVKGQVGVAATHAASAHPSGSAGSSATAHSSAKASASASTAPTKAPTKAPTNPPTERPTVRPTAESSEAVGNTATITIDDEDWAYITVSDVKFQPSFAAGAGTDEKPLTDGYVFVSVKIKYEAAQDDVEYSLFEWELTVDGVPFDQAIVLHGPEPSLDEGTLAKGESVTGYIVWEVPKTGTVRLEYLQGPFSTKPAVFDVLLRNK